MRRRISDAAVCSRSASGPIAPQCQAVPGATVTVDLTLAQLVGQNRALGHDCQLHVRRLSSLDGFGGFRPSRRHLSPVREADPDELELEIERLAEHPKIKVPYVQYDLKNRFVSAYKMPDER